MQYAILFCLAENVDLVHVQITDYFGLDDSELSTRDIFDHDYIIPAQLKNQDANEIACAILGDKID